MKTISSHLLFILVITIASCVANPTAVLFNDTSLWYHWGCTGNSTSLKEGIENLGFDLKAVPINATYSLQEVPSFEEFNDPQAFDRFSISNQEIVDLLRSAAAVVIAGEGTIHDLRAGSKALLYLAHASKDFLQKHVEIINHSAYPKDNPSLATHFLDNFQVEQQQAVEDLERAKSVYKTIYNELDFVAIREPMSQEAMSSIGVASTLSFDCLPLYIRDHYATPKKIEKQTLVLAGSVVFSEEGVEQLANYLETMFHAGFTIKVLIGAAAFASKDDVLFVDCLTKNCRVPWDLINASSMEQWLDTIHSATLFVSGRFHHSIAAFCLNTPFIALNSNTHKVHAICSVFGKEPPLLFSDPHLAHHLLSRTEAILSSPAPDNREILNKIYHLAERNFDGLKALQQSLDPGLFDRLPSGNLAEQ